MKKSELAEKTKLELLEIARKEGLAGRSKMDKDELVSSLVVLLKETKKAVPSKKSGGQPASKAKLKATPAKKAIPIKKHVVAKKTGPAKEEEASLLPLAGKSEAPMSVIPVKVAPLLKKSSISKNFVPAKVGKGAVRRRDEKEAVAAVPSKAGKAERWQDKVEDTKFYLGAEERAFVGEEELPAGYGDNRIVLMARDPHWAYVYWEINSRKIAEAKKRLSAAFDDSRLILRVYDITGIEFDGKNAHSFFDIEIPNLLGNWYVPLGSPNRSFCIDIGYREAGGGLFPLSRSNKVTSPRDTFSEVRDEEWVGSDEEYKKIYAMSGGVGHAGASAELAEMMKKRLEKEKASGGVRGLEPKETSSNH